TAIFEEHRFTCRQPHDVFHRVLYTLDETRASLRILVLRRGSVRFSGLTIVKISAGPGAFAHAILMIQADVEPDRRIERTVLVQAQPGQLIVKNLTSFRVSAVHLL